LRIQNYKIVVKFRTGISLLIGQFDKRSASFDRKKSVVQKFEKIVFFTSLENETSTNRNERMGRSNYYRIINQRRDRRAPSCPENYGTMTMKPSYPENYGAMTMKPSYPENYGAMTIEPNSPQGEEKRRDD
jgi:hypothetical protein